VGGPNLLRRGKSIHYAAPEEEDEAARATQVFSSQFMLKFTLNLENLIKNDVGLDNSKSDMALKSLSIVGGSPRAPAEQDH
jgi:hypothetical protein